MLSFKQIKKFFLEGESPSLMKNFFGRNKCLHKEVANNVLTTRAKKHRTLNCFDCILLSCHVHVSEWIYTL